MNVQLPFVPHQWLEFLREKFQKRKHHYLFHKPRPLYGANGIIPQTGDYARSVSQPLYPQHPPPTSSATTCRRQTERNRNSGAYRLQQFQLPKQMFSRNVWMPSLGIYGESEEINLIVVCFNIAIVRKTSFHPTFAVS